jgi:hypothetical protein
MMEMAYLAVMGVCWQGRDGCFNGSDNQMF